MKFLGFVFLALLALSGSARKITLEDVTNYKLVGTEPVTRTFSEKNPLLLEKSIHKDGQWIYRFVDTKTGSIKAEHHAADVLMALKKLSGMAEIGLEDIADFQIDQQETTLLFYIARDLFTYSLNTQQATRITNSPYEKVGFEFSPDTNFVSYIENYNLWLTDLQSNTSRQLTFNGNAKLLYGRLDWVYQEELFGRGNYKAYWWSPDSQKIAFLRINESPVKDFPIVDDLKVYSDVRLMSYPKAGSANPIVDIGVIHARGGEIVWVDLDQYALHTPLIVGVSFDATSSNVIYQVQDRIQSWLHIRSHNLQNKKSTTLWAEKSATWVNRLQEAPEFVLKGFYFLSEQDGYAHIYFHEYDSGASAKQLTSGQWDVKSILRVADNNIYFSSNKDSLLSEQIYNLNLSDLSISRMTENKFHHDAVFSPDAQFAILSFQSYEAAPIASVFAVEQNKFENLRVLFKPDTSKFDEISLPSASYFTIKNRHDQDMQAMIIKPANFDDSKKYPVLTYVYCGPKLPVVKNRFNVAHKMWHNYWAQEGYVVWMLDCHSANSYGRVGEERVHKKLGMNELEDIEDGVAFLKSHDWVDPDRLALWGWSYGGYMTSYAMTRKNMFKMGIAVAPLTDWRLYDSIYTERYMCTPQDNQDGYSCSSVLEKAADLSGELLLVHGTVDDNVHPHNVHKFAYLLQSAKKTNFQQMFYPDNEHSIKTLRPHLFATMAKFIRGNL